jgi:mannose-6-phosphate isomerase-like protein (cupin superfamily)
MRFQTTAGALFAVLLAGPSMAQTPMRARPPEPFKYLSAKEVDALTNKPGPGVKTGFPVDHEDYDVEYAERSDKGNEPEVHTYRTHYIHVLAGESVLTYGGTVTNARETSPGQIRGDAITGGTSMTVHQGDFLQIPAGMPHLFEVKSPTVKFRYLVFNARQ